MFVMEKMIFMTVAYMLIFSYNILLNNCVVKGDEESSMYAVEPWPCGDNINYVDRAKIYYAMDDSLDQENTVYDLYATNSACYKCAMTLVAYGATTSYNADTNTTNFKCGAFWTAHRWQLFLVENTTSSVAASVHYHFSEKGSYDVIALPSLNGSENGEVYIQVEQVKSPVKSLTALIVLLSLLVVIIIGAFLFPCIWSWCIDDTYQQQGQYSELNNPLSGADADSKPTETILGEKSEKKKKARVSSLDTFRGFSLTIMIFANYGGGGYWFMDHSPWNGVTVADLVFPWFMWMMGVSMALSFSSSLPKSLSHGTYEDLVDLIVPWKVWKRVLRRTFILFALNLFLNNGYDYDTWRIPGVLFYFSISYFVTAATVLLMHPLTETAIQKVEDKETVFAASHRYDTDDKFRFRPYMKILLSYRYEWLIQFLVLFTYLAIVFGVKAPGCPRGYNGPGGISEDSKYESCTGGIHRYIDMKVFGYDSIYHHPTCVDLYQCIPYDPEGLLGAFSACTLTYLGLMSGRVLLHYKTHSERLTRWGIWALFFLLFAGCLCSFRQNGGLIPLNKNLWSTSFVLFSAGGGLVGLSFCYILVDVYKVWTGAPFLYLGMNSILIYVGSDILQPYFPFSYKIENYNHNTMLTCTTVGVVSWIIVAYYFYRIKFFVKI